MIVEELTKKQAAILRFIVSCWRGGYLPSVREIGTQFDVSPHCVSCHLDALRRKGFVRDKPGRPLHLSRKAMKWAGVIA